MSHLEASGLRKSFGSLVAASGISLAVAAGEVLGVIGPNGAGKSTLFNLITGDLKPDAGTITFGGSRIDGLPPHRRTACGLARSYQVPLPFTHLSVFENLVAAATAGGALELEDAYDHSAAVLELTGLLTRANQPAHTLGLLDRKRLELARALATKPSMLLLDEIAGGLTEAECSELIAVIRTVHSSGVSIVWIEHVLGALLQVADGLLVLDFGEKIAEGLPDAVIAAPFVREIDIGIPGGTDE